MENCIIVFVTQQRNFPKKINVVAQWYLVTWRESMNHQAVHGIYVHI